MGPFREPTDSESRLSVSIKDPQDRIVLDDFSRFTTPRNAVAFLPRVLDHEMSVHVRNVRQGEHTLQNAELMRFSSSKA